MNILVFGASGNTGLQLVKQALVQHHQVSAFVRKPSRFALHHKNLSIYLGHVQNYRQVENAIREKDAVFSTLGAAGIFKRDFDLIKGIENIVMAMTKLDVRRLIYQSFAGVHENRKELGFMMNRIFPALLRNVVVDHEAKENAIIHSMLDWTIVRCPMLTNGSHTGVYEEGEHIRSRSILPIISRADVADFMLRQLSTNKNITRKPRVMYQR